MSLQECLGCGVVQTDEDSACPVCGGDRFEAVAVGGGDSGPDDAEEDDEWPCGDCDQSFDSKRALVAHSRVHDE